MHFYVFAGIFAVQDNLGGTAAAASAAAASASFFTFFMMAAASILITVTVMAALMASTMMIMVIAFGVGDILQYDILRSLIVELIVSAPDQEQLSAYQGILSFCAIFRPLSSAADILGISSNIIEYFLYFLCHGKPQRAVRLGGEMDTVDR
jgi:hypothetical protein